MPTGDEALFEEAKESLERIQQFDVETLPRVDDLGSQLNFSAAVAPAKELVALYKRLSIAALEDFPDNVLSIVRDNANSHFKLFTQALEFSATQDNPSNTRTTIIANIEKAYAPAFQALHPYIAYSLHRSADFQRLDSDARSTLQTIEDRAAKISEALEGHEVEAKRVLDEIRNVAAEEGVTQQAAHFRAEADEQAAQAEVWRARTIKLALGLGGFAVLSIFLHKIPFLTPNTTYEAAQLIVSKILVFGCIAYVLVLSAKNFLNHKHNAIINRHRQNALMTHKALVEAAADSGIREAIMLQAASCIFAPQSTGYADTKRDDAGAPKSIVEILSKPLVKAAGSSSN